jgi:GNAT superfamily N-acetyltransferase
VDDDSSALERARPGERWVIRWRLADGSATDLIGWIDLVTAEAVQLWSDRTGTTTLQRSAVILARRAPAAPGGGDPLRVPADELERHALPGWLADSEPLGEWTLRAGGGFTGRANSCLAVGDPGRGVPQAAAAIESWSAAHGIPPRAQVIAGSETDLALSELGWRETYVATDVMVARLSAFLGMAPLSSDVRVTEDFAPEWLAAYGRSRPNDADPAVLEKILAGNPPRAFASAGSPEQVAIARGHVSGPWLGLASIWVDPDHRRRGVATAMMRALGHWAARRGARHVYLQVAAENIDATAAYERLGFARHHTYRYLAPAHPPLSSPKTGH